jgi:hypothetical protein
MFLPPRYLKNERGNARRRFITAYASGIFIATLLCRAVIASAAAKISAEIQANDAGPYLQ